MRTRVVLSAVLALTVVGALGGEDWNRFRGPNGTGISEDKTIPVAWKDSDILFRSKLPGKGHSSPIVVGKKVFLLAASNRERFVLCLDAVSGKEIWSKSVPGEVGKTHLKSSLASATPCSDGERLYCSFWDGKRVSLHAYDLEGKHLWEQDLGPFTSQHGPGFSPVVVEGRVIINLDQDKRAELLALDAKTGKQVWQVKRSAYRSCYSTPFLSGVGKGQQLIVASTAGITAYTLDGKEVWDYTWSFPDMPLRTVGSPVAVDGLVFAYSGDGRGDRNMIAVRPGVGGNKGTLVWQKDKDTPYVPTLLARDGHLFGVNDNGLALCYEAKTGKVKWQSRLCGLVSASPVMIDGKVYAADEKGVVHVFAADPAGLRVLARNDVKEAVFASPAVANGKLYVRAGQHLICVGKSEK